MAEKCADTELQLEIDIMVLDYLVFTAIKFILEDYERRRQDLDKPKSKSDMLLRLVDCENRGVKSRVLNANLIS